MAEVPVLEAADAAAAPPKSKKWLIIGIAAAVVLAGGGAGAWFFMGHGNKPAKEAEKPKEPAAPAQYVALDPPFVVNFEGDGAVRFLSVTVQIMTRNAETVEQLKSNDPIVRNDLLMLLSNQKYAEVSTREGKERLRGEALKAIRHVVETSGGKPEHVEQVLFTSFVMQ
jgi:flagellar protein FliL